MKNTTKLKNILQLYTLTLDMDEEVIHLTAISKRTGNAETFSDKSYSVIIGKAFNHMLRQIKKTS